MDDRGHRTSLPCCEIDKADEPKDAPQPRTVLYFNGGPIPRGEVILVVPAVKTCNTLHIKHLSARMLGLVYWFTRAEGPA